MLVDTPLSNTRMIANETASDGRMPKIPHPEGEAIGGNTMTTLTAVYPATTGEDDETTLFAAADSEPRSQQIAAAEPAPLPGDVPFENAAEWVSIL